MDVLYANAKDFTVGDFRLEQPPYLKYLSSLVGLSTVPTSILYPNRSSLRDTIYYLVFSPVCQFAGVLSLEVKYDRFRDRDEEYWQKHLEILTTQDH